MLEPRSSSAYELAHARNDLVPSESESAAVSSVDSRQKRNVTFASAECTASANQDCPKQLPSTPIKDQNASLKSQVVAVELYNIIVPYRMDFFLD